MGITNLGDKIKKYYKFDKKELIGLVVAILTVAFIISFNDWGAGAEVDLKVGLFNFFNAILITTFTFLVVESAVRIAALSIGYKAEYQVFTIGLVISVVVAFVSRGFVWFLLPSGMKLDVMTRHRLGHHRYEVNFFGLGVIALVAPLTHILLAVFFKVLAIGFSSALITKAINLNILLAVYHILPIPPMAGSKVYFGSRMLFSFSFVGIIIAAVLLASAIPAWMSIVAALVIAAICWLLYYIFFEKDYWRGTQPKW